MVNPFAKLEVPFVDAPSSERVKSWWMLYRMRPHSTEFAARLRGHLGEIDESLVVELLSQTNWRPRLVGGYLAAAANLVGLEEHLGRLFLRSDACYSGRGYCLALSRFNTPASLGFLREYLDHYIERLEYRFEQGDAMAALTHLDAVNGTAVAPEYDVRWKRFAADKNWELPRIIERFECDRLALEKVGRGSSGV